MLPRTACRFDRGIVGINGLFRIRELASPTRISIYADWYAIYDFWLNWSTVQLTLMDRKPLRGNSPSQRDDIMMAESCAMQNGWCGNQDDRVC